MILDILPHAERYCSLHPRFAEAFAFLRREDLATLAPGRHPLDGEHLFAIVAHDQGKAREAAKLESHRRYIDIQYVIGGDEQMGWRPTVECRSPEGPYDSARDLQFFHEEPTSWARVQSGGFCIFFPEDAHMPLIGEGAIHKVVVKVAVG